LDHCNVLSAVSDFERLGCGTQTLGLLIRIGERFRRNLSDLNFLGVFLVTLTGESKLIRRLEFEVLKNKHRQAKGTGKQRKLGVGYKSQSRASYRKRRL